MSPAAFAARRVRFDLAYDGTGFQGWQLQARGRTVQGTVEQALTRIQGGERVRLRVAGRTDSGVHARQQVADGVIRTKWNDAELAHSLGGLLPADVRPLAVRTVADSFHAASALRKTYRYRLERSRWGDPLRSRFALGWPHALDRTAIDEALALLPGRRDWSGFAGPRARLEFPVRTLFDARLCREDAQSCWFSFTGDGFLHYMVRKLVGALLEIGRGRYPADHVRLILSSGRGKVRVPVAAARGLCLWSVVYDD